MNEEQWFEEVGPAEEEANRKKGWDEDFDRPVAQCALEERIWEEQAANPDVAEELAEIADMTVLHSLHRQAATAENLPTFEQYLNAIP